MGKDEDTETEWSGFYSWVEEVASPHAGSRV